MSTTEYLELVREALGDELTTDERRQLRASTEWEELKAGVLEREVHARDCADLVRSWRLKEEVDAALPAGPLPTGELARLGAKAMLCWTLASEDQEVVGWRSQNLGDEYVALSEVGEWIQARADTGRRFGLLAYPGEHHVHRVKTTAGTELDRLRQLSQRLALEYGWREDTATAFVLCDRVPMPRWVEVDTVEPDSFGDRGRQGVRITMDIDPDTPAEVVAQLYNEQRRKMERAHRPPAQATLDRFEEWLRLDRPEWSRLPVARWNEEYGRRDGNRSARRALTRCWTYFTGEAFSR